MKRVRNTPQRALVKRILTGRTDHPTADRLYELARLEDPHISRGTVYRNLKLLYELGEIRRFSMPIGPDHYDPRMDNHYHFCCRKCGMVVDTNLEYNENFNKVSGGLSGYHTEWHRLVLVGVCPECGKQEVL